MGSAAAARAAAVPAAGPAVAPAGGSGPAPGSPAGRSPQWPGPQHASETPLTCFFFSYLLYLVCVRASARTTPPGR
jgi:hypothetical protein